MCKKKMLKDKILSYVAEFRLRLGRGQGLLYELRNAVVLAGMLKILLETTLLQTIIITLIVFVGFYFIGWIDFKYLKLFQKERELSDGKYNPYLISKLGKMKNGKKKN